MKTIEEIKKQEETERLAYETSKVVTEQGETIADLRKIFDAVCNQENWKSAWAAKVPHQIVGGVLRAVEFFHADIAKVIGVEQITGFVLMTGDGYKAY